MQTLKLNKVYVGKIPRFRTIEYYSQLLNHVSKIGKFLHEQNIQSKDPSYLYIFVAQGLSNFLTRDLVTLNNTLLISSAGARLSA